MSKMLPNILKKKRKESYGYLVAREDKMSFVTESFQKLVLNLEYANVDNQYKVIQFTSTLQAEGKTTLFANIAYLLADKGKKVVVLDLDLRRPKLNRVFSEINKDGITDYLAGKITYEQLLRVSEDGIYYMVAGEKTTAVINLLESKKLEELINKLKEDFDYVLLDTPPVLAVADTLIINKISDGVIFVVGFGKAKKALVRDAFHALERNNAKIIGIGFTQVKMTNGVYGYKYSYKYD
nr:CpsD/CapB family tyrosine-protein kinase [Paracholeplasma sp.]